MTAPAGLLPTGAAFLGAGAAGGLEVANYPETAGDRIFGKEINSAPRFSNVTSLTNHVSKQHREMVKDVQKEVPGATESQIDSIVKEGFDSGDFCSNDHLFKTKQVRKYIVKKLKK